MWVLLYLKYTAYLQRDRKYEKKLEEKNKEIERDNIENENGGALDDLYAGSKKIVSGVMKGARKLLSLVGF